MSIDEIVGFAWVVWLALILIFLVVEIFTVDMTFLMLAVASVGGVITALVGFEWFWQLVIVGVLAIALILALRPPLLRALRRGEDPTKSNINALIGLGGKVTTAFSDGLGHVKLANGETWTSKGAEEPLALKVGTAVTVIAIEGATAIVEPVERTSK
jgi:membrane protein implicated in regulation of membrane protease activity